MPSRVSHSTFYHYKTPHWVRVWVLWAWLYGMICQNSFEIELLESLVFDLTGYSPILKTFVLFFRWFTRRLCKARARCDQPWLVQRGWDQSNLQDSEPRGQDLCCRSHHLYHSYRGPAEESHLSFHSKFAQLENQGYQCTFLNEIISPSKIPWNKN